MTLTKTSYISLGKTVNYLEEKCVRGLNIDLKTDDYQLL
jgi:hypothetical protein